MTYFFIYGGVYRGNTSKMIENFRFQASCMKEEVRVIMIDALHAKIVAQWDRDRKKENGEIMALENLYQCSKEEVSSLHKDFADAFFNDDLYHVAFPNEATRKECLEYFFKNYLQAIAAECYFLADSEEKRSIIVIYDSRKYKRTSYWFRLIKMNLKFLKFIKLAGIRNCMILLREWDMFSSRWVKNFVTKEHFHLDLIYTKEAYRGQGIALKMIDELLDEAQIMEMDVSVETHHEDNANWYKKMGFILMNTVVDASSNLHQYCLLIRNSKE